MEKKCLSDNFSGTRGVLYKINALTLVKVFAGFGQKQSFAVPLRKMWHSGALSTTVSAKRPGGCVFCARFNAGLWNMLYRASPRTLGAYFTWLALFILQRARNDLKNVLGLVRRLFSRYLYFLPKVSGLRLKLGATTAFTDELCSYSWFWTRELLVSSSVHGHLLDFEKKSLLLSSKKISTPSTLPVGFFWWMR